MLSVSQSVSQKSAPDFRTVSYYLVCGFFLVDALWFDAVKESGNVFSWGRSDFGQTGRGSGTKILEQPAAVSLPERAIDVACGSEHTVLLLGNQAASLCLSAQRIPL